jgi:hypothetical protein
VAHAGNLLYHGDNLDVLRRSTRTIATPSGLLVRLT